MAEHLAHVRDARLHPARKGRLMKIEDIDGLAEANVAAEFYHQCRLLGLRCYLEVPAYSSAHTRSNRFRIDCLVTHNNEALCAIEFKTSGSTPGRFSRQARAYDGLGIPWTYCIGQEQVIDTINWVLSLKARKDLGAAA